ncbi:MAG: hypothetical protein GC192_20125 [Bacteroidetes bacterium]|nr:hypothetical protein [Bacteroidota bacterium]
MKKHLRHLAILLSLITASLTASGQNMQVFYNLYNDSISYLKNGKPVNSLRIRKGDEVRVHLTEYNPFVSEIELTVEEITDDSGSGMTGMAGMGSLMPGMPNLFANTGMEGESGQFFPMLNLDLPVLTLNDSIVTLKSLFQRKKGRGAEQIDQANQTMQEIQVLMGEISTVQNQLMANEQAMQVSRIALANIDQLRTESTLRPSLVKQLCQEYYETIFQKNANTDVSLNDLLAWQNLPSQHQFYVDQIKSKQGELNAKMTALDRFSADITSNQFKEEVFQNYTHNLTDFRVKTRSINEQLKSLTARGAPTQNLPNTQEMVALQLKLASVISNDFTYHANIKPSADQVNLDIKLLRKNPEGSTDTATVLKERNLKLEVRGGLKVKASAGVSFGQFFEPAQSYSVRNGVIVSEDDGVFTPTLTSFLHFHGYRGLKATVGGTFGAGIPLLSGDDGQGVEFFLGPSVMFGTNQRLVLTLGLKGGKVQRLSKGYKNGDPFDTDLGDIPTKGKYGLGLFLGASFNLGI